MHMITKRDSILPEMRRDKIDIKTTHWTTQKLTNHS